MVWNVVCRMIFPSLNVQTVRCVGCRLGPALLAHADKLRRNDHVRSRDDKVFGFDPL
jgi:hypothetical protein